MGVIHKTSTGKRAIGKAAYGVRRTIDADGERNEYAFVSGVGRIPVRVPPPGKRDDHAEQLAVSMDAGAFLDELAETSPDFRDAKRAKAARPFVAVSLNPAVDLAPERRARAWRRWEEEQGLAGCPYIEWAHGKHLEHRPPHHHRLYLRIRVDGDARIIGMSDDWPRNELASALTAYDNRDVEGMVCRPGRHAVWVHGRLAERHPEVRPFFVGAVRARLGETNAKRMARGQEPFAEPEDDAAACRLFVARCLDVRKPAFFRPDRGPARGATLHVARAAVPLLSAASGHEESRAALAGTPWRLAQGRHAPVLVCVRAPETGATGASYGLGLLYRTWFADTQGGVEPDRAEVGRWIAARVAGGALPPKAEVEHGVDPERGRLKSGRKALAAARREVRLLKERIRGAGRDPKAAAARRALDNELKAAKARSASMHGAFEDARAVRVETSVVRDPVAVVAPWVARPEGLFLAGMGKRKKDAHAPWNRIARALWRSLARRTGGEGTATIYGGNGGLQRADRLVLALHEAGRPPVEITNVSASRELRDAARRGLVRAEDRRTAAATEAMRGRHYADRRESARDEHMLWALANPPASLLGTPRIAAQAERARALARQLGIAVDPPSKPLSAIAPPPATPEPAPVGPTGRSSPAPAQAAAQVRATVPARSEGAAKASVPAEPLPARPVTTTADPVQAAAPQPVQLGPTPAPVPASGASSGRTPAQTARPIALKKQGR